MVRNPGPDGMGADRHRERQHMAAVRHEHDPELINCRECGSEFDLARQDYYDNLCPECFDEVTP